jgi:hypothetical protein
MKRQTIKTNFLKTIDWLGENIVDWSNGGKLYSLTGEQEQISEYYFAFDFDSSITSPDGQYAFIYNRLGTKGLLLKNGKFLREINRTYYHANVYEYPASFLSFKDRTYLVHCPLKYCQLDIEEVETGEILTNIPTRQPSDVFHSRIEVSPGGNYLMVKGWFWHPWDVVEVYDIAACFKNPLLLDKGKSCPGVDTEINSASFIDDARILIAASSEVPQNDENIHKLPPKHIAVWNIISNELSEPVAVKGEFGNIQAINEQHAWDLFKHPKIINIKTGEVESILNNIKSGEQCSAIIYDKDNYPQIRYNRKTSSIAIRKDSETIEILTPN